jgi:hypothetical protein
MKNVLGKIPTVIKDRWDQMKRKMCIILCLLYLINTNAVIAAKQETPNRGSTSEAVTTRNKEMSRVI